MAYNLNFINQTSSMIDTSGPFTLRVGEAYESNNLTLKTYNSGNIVFDLGTGAVLPATDSAVDIGATSSSRFKDLYLSGAVYAGGSLIMGDGSIYQDQGNLIMYTNQNGAKTAAMTVTASGKILYGNAPSEGILNIYGSIPGKALAIFNATNTDQNILTASSSGSTRFNLSNTGDISLISGTANSDIFKLSPNTSGSTTYTGTLTPTDLTGNRTWTLPDTGGTLGLSSSDYWQLNSQQLSPLNTTYDLLVGGTATSSALFKVEGLTGNASMSGSLTLGNGSVIRPTYGPLTLQYKSAADTWSDALTIQPTTGNIGVRTSSPSAPLHIAASGADPYIYLQTPVSSTNTGVKYPTAEANVNPGDVDWSNRTNIYSDNGLYASFWVFVMNTRYLHATDYDFAIPSDATINGIMVEIEKYYSDTAYVRDNTVQLIKGGTKMGDNKASGSAWPTSAGITTYGGPSDLWGLSFTPADINASDFGVALKAEGVNNSSHYGYVDYMRITVYYTPASTTQWALGGDNTNNASFKIAKSSSLTSNTYLTILTNGNLGIGNITPAGLLDVSGTVPGKALAIFNTTNTDQNILTASVSGATRFVLGNNGDLNLYPYHTDSGDTAELRFRELAAGGSEYVGFKSPDAITTSRIWTLPNVDSTGTQCLSSNGSGVLSWSACSSGSGSSNWQETGTGAIAQRNLTEDVLLGATATSSAKFAFINMIGGTTPTATISANSGNNATYLTGAGNLATTNMQTLSLGGSTTGGITLNSNLGLLDINSARTSGIISEIGASQAISISGALTGLSLDLSTNYTTDDENVTGIDILLDTATSTTSSPTFKGIEISSSGSLTTSDTGQISWIGSDITTPNFNGANADISSIGQRVTLGTITNSGDQYGLNILPSSNNATGNLTGIDVGGLTPGNALEIAIQIGSGWDSQIYFNDTSTSLKIADSGTITFEDSTGNDILALADVSSSSDHILTIDSDTNFQIIPSNAPAEDMMQISNVSYPTTTSNVDALTTSI
jgi:hypothetical protein